jgi:hypothetical protein
LLLPLLFLHRHHHIFSIIPPRIVTNMIVITETVVEKTKQTVGSDTSEMKAKANEAMGEAKGKASELTGQAKGKANEVQGQAKGKAEEVKGKM